MSLLNNVWCPSLASACVDWVSPWAFTTTRKSRRQLICCRSNSAAWKLRHKLAIVLESSSEKMDDGRPYTASQWLSLSGSIKSNLYKVRRRLLGRDLTTEERSHFEDSELVNRRVGYQIVHREGKEGTMFSNVENIWPLKDAEELPPLPF